MKKAVFVMVLVVCLCFGSAAFANEQVVFESQIEGISEIVMDAALVAAPDEPATIYLTEDTDIAGQSTQLYISPGTMRAASITIAGSMDVKAGTKGKVNMSGEVWTTPATITSLNLVGTINYTPNSTSAKRMTSSTRSQIIPFVISFSNLPSSQKVTFASLNGVVSYSYLGFGSSGQLAAAKYCDVKIP